MRISDWSSDVCSSDLAPEVDRRLTREDVSSDALRGREDVERSPHGAGDDAMLEQIRGHVRSLDQRHGREYDEQSERISHSLLALAKDKGLARIDQVVLSGKSEFVRSPGQNIFVVQGKLEHPAHIHAHMRWEERRVGIRGDGRVKPG